MNGDNQNRDSLIKSVRKLTKKKDGKVDEWHALVQL